MNVIAIVVLVGAVILLFFINTLEKSRRLNVEHYRRQWVKIVALLDNKKSYNLAVIEADKLLDQAFKEKGLKGQTMAERLATAGSLLSNKNEVWQVHKLRNRLVHEVDVQLDLKQTRRALHVFKQALKDVGAF